MLNNGNDVCNLADGWLELESDPGLFTLLLEDMGVEGVQVEEIYDLQAEPLVQPVIPEDRKRMAQLSKSNDSNIALSHIPSNNTGKVQSSALGFIFLFRWVEERRVRLRKIIDEEHLYVTDEKTVNRSLFFAQQIVPNSCATHALISILLNVPEEDRRLKLGSTLEQFKCHVDGMDPEMKGLAIGNSPELAQAHNLHAVPRARNRQDSMGRNTSGSGMQGAVQTSAIRQSAASQQGVNTETFHFVSYVPINGHLFELDGLKRYPIDHGPIPEGTDWTETFRKIIKERLGMATSDIRFALMALTPDPRNATLERLNMLRANRSIVVHALKKMVSNSSVDIKEDLNSEGETEILPDHDKNAQDNPLHGSVKKDFMDMETDVEEEWKSQQQFKELEKDVKRIFVEGNQDKPSIDLNKSSENKGQSNDTGNILKASSSLDLSTPPKPRRATSSRTNSLESNGAGVAPGSPFQNNPLLVSHDYSKSPMLIDEEETEVNKATPDELDDCDESQSLHVTEQSAKTNCSTDVKTEPTDEKSPKSNIGSVAKGHSINCPKIDESSENLSCTILSNSKLDIQEAIPTDNKLSDTLGFDPKLARLNSPQRFSPSSLLSLLRNIEVDISDCRSILKDANERRKRHAIDDCRRSHDYDQFIAAFLSMLAERGHLGDLLEHGINVAKKKYQSTNGNALGANSAGGSEGSSDNESNSKARRIKAKKALMKKKNKAKGVASSSMIDSKQRSKGRGRPKKK